MLSFVKEMNLKCRIFSCLNSGGVSVTDAGMVESRKAESAVGVDGNEGT